MTGKFADALTADAAGSPAPGEALATGAAAGLEETLAEVLAGVMHTEQVPAGSHFFDELGADSLVMAHFCARVRKRGDLPPVSMKDIYGIPRSAAWRWRWRTPRPSPPGPRVPRRPRRRHRPARGVM